MENIYTEWTVDDDKILFQNINKPVHKVASILGRGLNGVIARKKKLNNVNSAAYKRLFVQQGQQYGQSVTQDESYNNDNDDENSKKLIPVLEVLRRIKWDTSLNQNDFTIKYYDRVDSKIYQCPFNQPNNSIKGKQEMFVFAIPEHRIQTILYRDRIVWDKESRLDCVFGSMNGNGETISDVIECYDRWKQEEKEKEEFNKKRQLELADSIRYLLGDDLFLALKNMSKDIQEKAALSSSSSSVNDQDVTLYVNSAMGLFRKANLPLEIVQSSSSSSDVEIELLSLFSDLVALLPDKELREKILLNIYQLIRKIQNENLPKKNQQQSNILEKLNEDELTESFVRGSGAGGQKINKTANKVVLVHEPTQIRVECQETRSLQQNRKIARKRMQLKLDQHFNGVSSKIEMKNAEKINKKAKAKARNKARQRKKKEAAAAVEKNHDNDDII